MAPLIFFILSFLTACSGVEEAQKKQIKERNERKDLIHRLASEKHYPMEKLTLQVKAPYPWEPGFTGGPPVITKEAFRCKGNSGNPPKVKDGDKKSPQHDCGGASKHSLPVRGGKEFVYPVFLDILNYIQVKTGLPVVVTSGHRCPEHHNYVDPSAYSRNSKHMMGAEVDFYVVGMESKPLEVIEYVMAYYKETEPYKKEKEYVNFIRLDQVKVDISTTPWFNKEILIKLYKENEGRNLDNQHSYPYISLQVRFDREKKEKVVFSSDKASNGFMRH